MKTKSTYHSNILHLQEALYIQYEINKKIFSFIIFKKEKDSFNFVV